VDLDVWGTLSFRRLAHFVAVVEAGTISGAADRLFMSQSAVAGSVTELERALEADLLIRRRGRGVSLTPTGAEVLSRARSLLAGAAELNDLAHGQGTELAGPLAVGCFVTLAPTVLPRLLVEFEARHPRVTVSFHEGSQDALQEQLLAGQLDVAVMYDMDLTTSLNRVVLYEPRAYALFGAGHRFAAQPSVTLEQLAPEPLILFDTTPSTSYAMSLFERRGLQPSVRHRTHGYELTRSLVARNPSFYAILVQRPEIKQSYEGLPIIERELAPAVPPCPVVLAWPQDSRLSPRARELAEIARRHYGQRSPAAGQPGAPVADATASRTAAAMTSGAIADSTNGSAGTSPVAAQTTRSPSAAVALGAIDRATPALPARATSHASRLSSRASVTRQTSVVFSRVAARAGVSPASRRSVVRAYPAPVQTPAATDPSSARTSPNALTAASAVTVAPPTRSVAAPKPPFVQPSTPRSLPTVQPVPTPMLPRATSVPAPSHAATAATSSGRTEPSPSMRS